MNMAKNPTEQLITDIGELNWVFINGNPKVDKKGVEKYLAALHFHKDSEELKIIQEKIKAFWTENKPKGARQKSNGIKVVQRKVEGKFDENGDQEYEDTDFMSVNFWTGTKFPDGKDKVVIIRNARGSEVSLGSKKIGNGSLGAISGAMGIYDREDGKGVTLYLNQIKLKTFIEYAGGGEDFGDGFSDGDFAGVEGDFEGPAATEGEDTPKPRL
jgi:hypothetical protein